MSARYSEVAEELRRLCANLEKRGETRLPSEEELSRLFSCSRQTVRSALSMLEREGLIVKKRGSGSYLAAGSARHDDRVMLLVPDENEYLYPALIRELRQLLAARGFRLVCRSTQGLHARERGLLDEILHEAPAAVLLEAISDRFPNPNEDRIREIEDAGIPLSYLFCAYEGTRVHPCVREADREGAVQLAELLASAGHRRIGGFFRCDDSRGYERCAGFLNACAALGLELPERCVAWISAEERRQLLDGGTELLRIFLRQHWHGCDALICQNDELAHPLLRELERSGLSVPESIAVASFDDSYYASVGKLGLTSLAHRPHALAEAAAEAVFCAVKGEERSPEPVPWLLVRRESA